MIADTKDSFWKVVTVMFYIFFASFPFVYFSGYLYSGTSTRSLTLIVFSSLLAIGLGVWLFQKKHSLSLAVSLPFIVLTLYFLSLVISGITGFDFSTTFWSVTTRMTGIWYFLSLGIFMLMLWAVSTEERTHHTLILSIIVSTALYSILDLFGNDGLNWFFKNWPSDAFTFGNTTFAAMYIFGAFSLSLYYLFQAEKRKWWMYALPIALIINPNILNANVWRGDFSRFVGEAQATFFAIVLSVIALCGMWLVSKIKEQKTRSVVSYSLFGIGTAAVLFAAFSLLSPSGYLREAYLERSTAARPLVWAMSAQAIAERPVFGYGADNFERVFEQYYDNRLLQDEYGNEAWFDRAHNVFIDQLVDNGIVGLMLYLSVYLLIIWSLIYTALHASAKRDRIFASVLIVYFTLHIAELQTAFDTSVSYPMLAFLFVSALVLYHRTRTGEGKVRMLPFNAAAKYLMGSVLVGFFSWSLIFGAWPFAKAQEANGAIRKVGSSEKRIALYDDLFGSHIDTQAFLWRTATDFQRGIAQNPEVLADSKIVEGLKKELALFEQGYREYLKQHPTNFRAHLNLADILIYQNLFEIDKLAEAQAVLDQAIALVPTSPQPYWMKAVAYLYMGKFALAREYAQKGIELNPDIKQSQELAAYIERSIRSFPEVDLFFFRQI